jgi:hypothetical protein
MDRAADRGLIVRNWGTAVTAFYILIVAGLSPAAVILAVEIGGRPPAAWFSHIHLRDLIKWEYWAWVMLLAGGPLVLLLIQVGMPRKRSRPRRHILVAAAAAGLALALLVIAAAVSVVTAIDVGEKLSCEGCSWALPSIWLGSWLLWTLVLWRLGERLLEPAGRIYRWLVAGSVLELLIAIPSHVIVRQRHECCAPMVTGLGVATGFAILLMSLGPGTLFLYRARMRRLRPHEN